MKRVVKSLGLIILIICIANCNYIKALAIDNQWNFELTKTTEVFTVPKTGLYQIQAWGGAGGCPPGLTYAGSGGYSSGELVLKQGEKLYITIGEKGTISSGGTVAGGFNGGGSAYGYNCGSGGGATHVAFTSDPLSTISDKNLLMVAGGGGGRSNNTSSEAKSLGGAGGGEQGDSTNYAAGGTQVSGYAKGIGQNGYKTSAGAGGGGYWGGFASSTSAYGGAGGSGYLSPRLVNANTSQINYSNQNGKVIIDYVGEAKTTVNIISGVNGKINGGTSYEVTGNVGQTITLPTPVPNESYLKFVKYNIVSGDGVLNGNKFTFGYEPTFIESIFTGTKASFIATQTGNKLSIALSASSADRQLIKLKGRIENSSWTDLGTYAIGDYSALITKQPTTYGNGAVGTYVVPLTGTYRISLTGGGAGKDGPAIGGSGATIAFTASLTEGQSLYFQVGTPGADSGNSESWYSGGSGWSSGGSGGWSGGGGGSTGVTLNGSTLAVAGGGGGANWATGYGGRVSTNNSGNYSSNNGQNGYWRGDSDSAGGGGGWPGGVQGISEQDSGTRGAYGGRNGYNANLVPLSNIVETPGANGGGRNSGQAFITPEDFAVDLVSANANDTIEVTIPDGKAPDSPNSSFISKFNIDSLVLTMEKTTDYGGTYSVQIPNYTEVRTYEYISGFKGWRYVLNNSSSFTITADNSSITTSKTVTIPATYIDEYVHIAAVDNSGNISKTYTIEVPNAVFVSYDINKTQHNPSTETLGKYNNQQVIVGEQLILKDNVTLESGETKFSRVGYNLINWNTKADGTGNSYELGQGVMYEHLMDTYGRYVTLYAQWEPIKYDVVFHGNDNWNTSQGTYRQTLTFDKPENLTPNKFTRTAPYNWNNIQINKSYNYMGWGLTNKQTTVDFTDKQQVLNLRNTEGDYNIYAIWRRPIYLTFNLNGGKYKQNNSNIVLSAYIYNAQNSFSFNIYKGVVGAIDGVQSAQTNTIDAYGTFNTNGENKLYTKVSSDGTVYRFLGWSLNPNATEPDRDFDVFNPNRKTTYTIYNDTTLYAVWEPVLQANFEIDRTLGNVTFNDGTKPVTNLPALNSSKGEQSMSIILRPGEQGFYKIDSTGSNNLTFKIAFDTRITDIYTHGDPDSEWFDELNPSTHEDLTSGQGHGLNRQITGIKNFTRKFHIPQYLGTNRSYDTSNPDKTSVPVNKYVAVAVLSQPSYYYNTVYGTDEQIIININIYISPNNSSDFNNVEDKLPSIISEIRTRIL